MKALSIIGIVFSVAGVFFSAASLSVNCVVDRVLVLIAIIIVLFLYLLALSIVATVKAFKKKQQH